MPAKEDTVTDTTSTRLKLIFETQPCGRCNGTGRYSFNGEHSRCYQCNGTTVYLSRRGRSAQRAYEAALNASPAVARTQDLATGMNIWSQAHASGLSGAMGANLGAAWRVVAKVEFTESVVTRGGRDTENTPVDVAYTTASITFEDGKTWRAETSEDPAFWRKGAFRTIYTQSHFDVTGEAARQARREIIQDIARRFTGAWLEGEQPPVPASATPRIRKVKEVEEAKETPEPRTFPNRYAGECAKCGGTVEEEAGECYKDGSRWIVEHVAGECPQAEQAAPEAAPAPVGTESAPVVLITRAKLYPEVARPGPAWRWSYNYIVNAGPVCQYGTGLDALRGMLRRTFGRDVQIIEEWKVQRPAPATGTAPAIPKAAAPVTEEGMYRDADGSIFRVQTSETGHLYAKRFTPAADGKGAKLEYAAGAIRTLRGADRLNADEAAEIGRSFGICIVCAKALSHPKSLALGIGPDCRKNIEVSDPAPTVTTDDDAPASEMASKDSQRTRECAKVVSMPAKEDTMTTAPTLANAAAVTPEQLTAMTPPQADTIAAVLHKRIAELADTERRTLDSLHRRIGERPVKHGRNTSWPTTDETAEQTAAEQAASGKLRSYDAHGIATALENLTANREEAQQLRTASGAVDGEWLRRGMWSRFYLVNNADGHIHSSDSCKTLRWNTSIGWLPALSGLTEADAVKAHGPRLCTVCFPSAPLEWTVGIAKESKPECSGSRQSVELDASMARRISKYATCPVCEERVSVTSTWKLKTHPPKAAPAPEEAPAAAEPAPAPEEPQEAPEAPKKGKAPAAPTALHVSRFLANAGFQRSSDSTRSTTEGFKLSEMKGTRGEPTKVSVRWVESSHEGEQRIRALGLADFSRLPDNPKGLEMAAAYADALSARYRVEIKGAHVWVHRLDAPRRAAKGRPLAKRIDELLRENALPRHKGVRGYSDVTGSAVVQEADHVRIQVRPWEFVHGWTTKELNEAASQVTAALDAAGYTYTRADDVYSAVIKVTGKK
ncbi:hypothetical protein E6R60_26575 [Streptomyces sp. A0642]|uniref:DUF6011 domain-containing protein n=1 Tax=Streptomyces sp. A0642 TaxID=2563100 RepID=UPI0010A264AB|nr:DUF6011 domain-containing protein [Streptomyces sp. A0642]THA72498.1 hypothetical protein E6R60_26575 [Streptomyces sp. A0642]